MTAAHFIVLIIFLVFYVASRIVNENAIAKLRDDEKMILHEKFSGKKISRLLPFAFIAIAFFGVYSYFPEMRRLSIIIFFAIMIVYTGYTFWMTYTSLKELSMPKFYLRAAILSTVFMALGFSVFVAGVFILPPIQL